MTATSAHPDRAGRILDGAALLSAALLGTLGVLNLHDIGGVDLAWRQVFALTVGLVLLAGLRRLDPRHLPALGWGCYGLAVVGLAAVPLVGRSAFGARRWLSVGGFTVQPSELAKLGLLLVLAHVLTADRPPWRRLSVCLALAVPPIAMTAVQPDLSTAMLLAALVVVLLVASGLPGRILVPLLGGLVVLAPLAVEFLRPYQVARIQAVLSDDHAGTGWAVRQTHLAIATGGLFGRAGDPSHEVAQQYLPDRHTDLALVSVVATWGLLAGLAAVVAAVVLVWRVALASRAPRSPGAALFAAGFAGLVGAEFAVSLGGTLGVLPLAGVPFPLVGLGGTSAVVHLAALGIVLGCRRDGVRHRLWAGARTWRRPRLVHATAFGMSGLLSWYAFYAYDIHSAQGAELRIAASEQMTRCTRIPAARGLITDRHGVPLALSRTVRVDGVEVAARAYPHGRLLAPVLGFVGVATPADTARNPALRPGEFVGRAGVEQHYDAVLRGVDGRRCVLVDPLGRTVADAGVVPPTRGHDLRLALDLRLQRRMSRELAAQIRRSGGDVGGAVAMDPRTGQVLAMASLPAYDNRIFGPPVDGRALRRAERDPRHPMLQHVTQVTAPPGSVFKLVVAAANVVHGAVPPGRVVAGGGSFTYGGHTFGNWMTHPAQNMREALAWSNDVYFYKLALALGPDRIQRVGRALGVGELTGVDLPGESAGFFGTPATVAARGQEWYAGATVILGIGQGYITVTPLQVARWTAGVSTGRMVVPRLGLASGGGPENAPFTAFPVPPVRTLDFADLLGPVRAGMRAAVESGTAAGLRGLPVPVGGKTGSAEDPTSRNGEPDSWFTASAPNKRPVLVVTAFVRGGGHGSTTSGVVAERTLAYFLAHRKQIMSTAPAR